MKLYTSEKSEDLKKIYIGNYIPYPEKDLSPLEQIEWINEHYMDDDNVKTFSPYILNALNLIILKHNLTEKDIEVYSVYNGELFSLICYDGDGQMLVDTTELSDPISYIYKEYNELKEKKNG